MARTERELKTPIFASLALAFASLGDAFLYPFLPINGVSVGIPLAWIGVMLSINRFVRILANTRIAQLLTRYGFRTVTIVAAVLAIASTLGYAFASGIVFWLVLRITWGLSFSALRLSTIGYALLESKQGLALGISKGVQETGPMLALLFAPLLLTHLQNKQIFLLLAVLSLPALYFASRLPTLVTHADPITQKLSFRFPSTLNAITFLSAFVIDGVIVVVLGILFFKHSDHITLATATSLAALYLGYRKICLVLLSPAGGWMADWLGIRKVFTFSLAMLIVGLLLIATGAIEAGAVIVFTFYSIHAAITPAYATDRQNNPLASAAENATWRDLGAAVGTVVGGLLLESNHLLLVLGFAIFILALFLALHEGNRIKSFKQLYSWR